MNRLAVFASTVLVASVAIAETKDAASGGERLSAVERKAKLEAVVNQRAGGFLEKPGSAKSSIFYVDCQSRAPRAWIEESIAYFREVTKFHVNLAEGAFDLKNPQIRGEASIFIIEDDSLPVLLVAPENRWAAVNVVQIAKETRPAFFEARTKKELSRAFAYLCGATGSRYERSLTRGIAKQSDLDQNRDYELPMDVVQRFWDYMKPLGVVPAQRTTYLKACQEGWAPDPTNDVQRAIWNKVHQIPDKPITIEFDPKKDK